MSTPSRLPYYTQTTLFCISTDPRHPVDNVLTRRDEVLCLPWRWTIQSPIPFNRETPIKAKICPVALEVIAVVMQLADPSKEIFHSWLTHFEVTNLVSSTCYVAVLSKIQILLYVTIYATLSHLYDDVLSWKWINYLHTLESVIVRIWKCRVGCYVR